jgi:hypothetical protein
VLLGILSLLIGAALLGLGGLRQHALLLWGSIVLALAPPVFVTVFFAQMAQGAWLVLAVLGLATGALAAWPGTSRTAAKPAV